MDLREEAIRDLHEEIRQRREASLAKRKAQAEKFRQSALLVIGRLSDALRDPMNPGADLKEAKFYMDEALMAAFRMEPKEFDEDKLQNERAMR